MSATLPLHHHHGHGRVERRPRFVHKSADIVFISTQLTVIHIPTNECQMVGLQTSSQIHFTIMVPTNLPMLYCSQPSEHSRWFVCLWLKNGLWTHFNDSLIMRTFIVLYGEASSTDHIGTKPHLLAVFMGCGVVEGQVVWQCQRKTIIFQRQYTSVCLTRIHSPCKEVSL